MTNQAITNNLNYLIDPTFNKVNRLFVLSFKNEDEDINDRFAFSKYFMPNVEIKDFSVLIDGKRFFDVPLKNKEKCEKISEMSKNNHCTTGNLLDYEYFLKHYKIIVIHLSKQTELENLDLKKQINVMGKIINLLSYSSNEESKFAAKNGIL